MIRKTLFAIALSMFVAAATHSMQAQTSGTFVVNFTITVNATISSTANIGCQASAEVSDGPSGAKNLIRETASVVATRSGSTATCSVNIPYSWILTTASTDKVVLGYIITAPVEVPAGMPSQQYPQRISAQPRYASIAIPASGTTTTEDLTITF